MAKAGQSEKLTIKDLHLIYQKSYFEIEEQWPVQLNVNITRLQHDQERKQSDPR